MTLYFYTKRAYNASEMDRREALLLSTAAICQGLGDRADIREIITNVHDALNALDGDSDTAAKIAASVADDYIVCLEDGKKLKMLKRYLKSKYKMTEDQYRAKWGLPADYPMVAPKYAKKRSELAKKSGLGKK